MWGEKESRFYVRLCGQLLCLSVWMLPHVAGSEALMESKQGQTIFCQFSRGKGEAD